MSETPNSSSTPNAYYTLLSRTESGENKEKTITAQYRCSIHAQGAWNSHEQHMAASTGLLTYELEKFMPRDDMRIGRISLDIFGLIPLEDFSITTQIIRGGRTIELIEATLAANGKTCIVARAWRMVTSDTSEVAGLEESSIGQPEDYPEWQGIKYWDGGFIKTIYMKADPSNRNGKGVGWINTDMEMVEENGVVQPTSDFVHLMGLADIANGLVPRISQPNEIGWLFPNLDLQIHLYRKPQGRWLGFRTVQQIGMDGVGLTSSVLHDEKGAFGHCEQILTVRKV